MPTTARYKLSIVGELATLTLERLSGDDCSVAPTEWVQDQWFGPGSDTVYKVQDNCLPARICLTPCLVYAASNDGFADAESAFDQTEDYLEFLDDAELVQFWGMDVDLTGKPLPKEMPFTQAYLEFRLVSAAVSATFAVESPETLPGTAPESLSASGAIVENAGIYLQIPVTAILQEKLAALAAEGVLESLPLLVQIIPTGTSSDPVQVASSRHATLRGPRLIVVQ